MAKTIILNENQLQKLFEFEVANKQPSKGTGAIRIDVYGDRELYTPHCHVKTNNGNVELEVSLLDWNILMVKRPNLPKNNNDWSKFGNIKKAFFKWLNEDSNNKVSLYKLWDKNNPNYTMKNFVDRKQITTLDTELVDYLKSLKDAQKKIIK